MHGIVYDSRCQATKSALKDLPEQGFFFVNEWGTWCMQPRIIKDL